MNSEIPSGSYHFFVEDLYSALQMKLPTENLFGLCGPSAAGHCRNCEASKHLPPPCFQAIFQFIYPMNSSQNFFSMEFASQAWYLELDWGTPNPAARSHQICQHVE